ncbi:hypothetical protein PHYSODRAFT_307603 [Phytophthora sojae]|uniref:Uncharacterized protein n=1 Tax=Phytophthora sojae (strain P6497) TaxID=1094619 RepID=G5AFC3_PHYSP|nr:hypothetical protein PHYSODRAFT_307603 [Phytophthora sojae]EGZ05913.1 hypothetical protein PHYSODRAFT_307603 [Phytophthora sojae]|eukprot:XP_009538774.1 hypothetical protein PHYSODRAFT_307603 [Phytophthora sojae]
MVVDASNDDRKKAAPKKATQSTGAASGPKPQIFPPIPNAFTYCARSISYTKIMNTSVQMQLIDLVLSSWNPMEIVKADLDLRKQNEKLAGQGKPRLSSVVRDEELLVCALQGLACAPGFVKEKGTKRKPAEMSEGDIKPVKKKARVEAARFGPGQEKHEEDDDEEEGAGRSGA